MEESELTEMNDDDILGMLEKDEPLVGGKREKKETHHEKKDTNDTKDYAEYLNRYFNLKAIYDAKTLDLKKKKKSPVCLQCGKAGGTIFSQKNNRYVAICGAHAPATKCALHLELYRGFFTKHIQTLYEYKSALEISKDDIIRLQNDNNFHYTNNVATKFEAERANYETITQLFMDLKKCIYDNAEIATKREQKVAEIGAKIMELRSILDDYKTSHNTEFIQLLVKTQIDDFIPLLDQLRELKYEAMRVDIRELMNTTEYMKQDSMVSEKRETIQSVLRQFEVNPEKGLINLKETPTVIRWDI